MELFRSFLRNTRKPEGFLGKCMVASMNYAHAALADWGLGCLPKTGPVRIAELGCGGGRNIRALLRKYPAATVTALDYSEISVKRPEISIRKNCRPAAAVSYREMFLASLSRIGHLIWRLPLKRYISGPAPRRVSGRCTASCGRAASF